MPPVPPSHQQRDVDDQDDLAFRGCLWFTAFAWLAPIFAVLLFGWAVYRGLR